MTGEKNPRYGSVSCTQLDSITVYEEQYHNEQHNAGWAVKGKVQEIAGLRRTLQNSAGELKDSVGHSGHCRTVYVSLGHYRIVYEIAGQFRTLQDIAGQFRTLHDSV
jgi:hypothetical protein